MKLINLTLLNRPFHIFLLAGLFFWIGGEGLSSFAQETPAAAATGTAEGGAEGAKTVHKEKTVWGVIYEGGWIMFPLGIISMWCLALIIEGFIRIRLVNFAQPDMVYQLKAAFAEENYQQAWRICKSKSTFLSNILRYGLERIGKGRAACEAAIAEHTLKESMPYRTKISYLSTIGVISPMVGLLGTVTGMIKAFQALGESGIADPSKLAAAIGEVLIATATGLGVAIPAFFLYYFFRNRLQLIVVLAEDVINQLMADVKYDELQGVKIGESMEAELGGGAAAARPLSNKRVSQAISGVTMACPQCNAPIAAGAPQCASCGTALQWN